MMMVRQTHCAASAQTSIPAYIPGPAINVLDALTDMIQRKFSPATLHLFERGQGEQYWDILADTQAQIKAANTRRPADGTSTALLDVPKSGDSVEEVCRRLTQLGHWDAHAFLALPFVGPQESVAPNVAPSSVLVLGVRTDGRPYSSFHAALTAGIIRLAVLRIQAIEERALSRQQMLQDRCLGPDRKALSAGNSDVALDAPARGVAVTLLLRFSGLAKASERLSPQQFKQMMDALYESASAIALSRGGSRYR